MELDFTVIKRSGLTQVEFAVLCKVTRTTTNLWVAGKTLPHRYIRPTVQRVLALLNDAVELDLLPLATEQDERATRIRLAMRDAAKKPQTVAA